jgi:PIN domain nuclease of toxin-antitoxin system
MSSKPLKAAKRVLDASALLAWFQKELGFEMVRLQLEHGGVIAVPNMTEVIGKLVSRGISRHNEVERDLLALGLEVVPMDQEIGLAAAYFYARRNPYNLSLGDCACLATAEILGLEVLTAEQGWAQLSNLRTTVRLIRSTRT